MKEAIHITFCNDITWLMPRTMCECMHGQQDYKVWKRPSVKRYDCSPVQKLKEGKN